MYNLKVINKNGLSYLASPSLLERSIFLAFTTRNTGISCPPYDSLNLAFHVNDQPRTVIKNRQLIAKEFGFDLNKLTCTQQVHGNNVVVLKDLDIGKGAIDYETALPDTDGLVTNIPNAPIGMFFADCLPVVLVSLDPKIVAIAHAGYKGILNDVILNTKSLTSSSSELLVFLGPCVEPCCYKVSKERLSLFKQKFPEVEIVGESIDLKKLATHQLIKAGIKEANIYSADYCTSCNDDMFYSYRKNNVTGRHAAIAYIG